MSSTDDYKETRTGDLIHQAFQKFAHQSVDWITDYLENMDDYPVLAQTKPGEVKSQFSG